MHDKIASFDVNLFMQIEKWEHQPLIRSEYKSVIIIIYHL